MRARAALKLSRPFGSLAIWMAPRPNNTLGIQMLLVPCHDRNVGTNDGQWKPLDSRAGISAVLIPATMAPAGRRMPHSTTAANHTNPAAVG